MRPYDRLAPYFGAVFPCSAEHRACYDRLLPEARGRRVLDVGFGTGEHAAYLAARGAAVSGLEVEARLVEWARRRFPAFAGDFRLGSMSSAAETFPGERFDLVLLVGNTLPHAEDLDEARETLQQAARLTAPGGCLVVSTVNYDRVLAGCVTVLPPLRGTTADGRPWEFYRSYDLAPAPRKVIFHTRLVAVEETVEGCHDLLAVTRRELEDATRAAFARVQVHGGYREEPWSMDGFGTVVIAREPREAPVG